MADAVVGMVANPLAGRDIRRLVATASVFPTAEKANMVQRMLTACGTVGVDRVLLNTDLGGISAAVLRAVRGRRPGESAWPEVEFLESAPIRRTAADTTEAVRRMCAAGARVVVCLGGDGTARVAAAACGETPLLAVSTGTNNAFGQVREATVAGLAAGLVATGAVHGPSPSLRPGGPSPSLRPGGPSPSLRPGGPSPSLRPGGPPARAPVLEVTAGGRREIALVDVALSTHPHVGSRAVWDPSTLTELYCTFAEPDGIGLSSVAGLLCPSPRGDADGVALRLGPPQACDQVVRAPIAPGLVADVGIRDWRRLPSGATVESTEEHGVIAVDGEREIEFTGRRPVVRLRPDGPRCVDVPAVLAEAARRGLLITRTDGRFS